MVIILQRKADCAAIAIGSCLKLVSYIVLPHGMVVFENITKEVSIYKVSILANIMVKGYCTSSWCAIVI